MSAVVTELDANLQALRALKPPGVTKSKIAAITALCVENIASESVLVQKIFTHFKKTPATHKLGVLYVVDSVTRQWVDKARVTGQELTGSAAADGTYAAGVYKMTELLPSLMSDLIQSAPDDQMEKIGKLLDIWERGNTFPHSLLSNFKAKLSAKSKVPANSAPSAAPLTALPAATSVPVAASLTPNLSQSTWGTTNNISTSTLESMLRGVPSIPSVPPIPVAPQPSYPLPVPAPPTSNNQGLAQALEMAIPPHVRENKAALEQHVQLLQQLAQLNVPQEQWPTVLAAYYAQQSQQNTPAVPQAFNSGTTQIPNGTQASANNVRSRSRSPGRRRGSPNYGYSRPGGDDYRQRSPLRDNTPSRQEDKAPTNSQPKWIEFDPSLPPNHIKVLSRTLFVGGVTCTDNELRTVFNRFGKVQTVVAQSEKRHAFVKMCDRAGAVNAKEKMESTPHAGIRSTRWGVGFGPRDCSDYQTGISIIPIDRLTDADKKWVVSAEFGGTGGKPLATGLVIEEPDIEIGAGVSSKAISRRVGGHEGGRRGGNSGAAHGRGSGGGNQNDGGQRGRRQEQKQPEPQQMMPMGFNFPGMMPPGVGAPGMGAPGMGFQ